MLARKLPVSKIRLGFFFGDRYWGWCGILINAAVARLEVLLRSEFET